MQTDQIVDANVSLGKQEANYYDDIHSEIFNKHEQARLNKQLDEALSLIKTGGYTALDVGCGTGNLALKLLQRGYKVTAVDVSPESLVKLILKAYTFFKSGQLIVKCRDVSKLDFKENSFDFVCCYSTLHHLPYYQDVVENMTKWVKKGGVVYIDHETTEYVWKRNQFIQKLYNLSCGWLNGFYVYCIKRIPRNKIQFDYHIADYHTNEDNHIRRWIVGDALYKCNPSLYIHKSYLLYKTHLWNPVRFWYGRKYVYDTHLWMIRK